VRTEFLVVGSASGSDLTEERFELFSEDVARLEGQF